MQPHRVVVVDLGTGNLRSVTKAVNTVSPNSEVHVSAEPSVIADADHMILPGQGAIGTWLKQLEPGSKLRQAVMSALGDKPVLGICLGLQALYRYSSENGGQNGFDLISGSVKHFSEAGTGFGPAVGQHPRKIPHMGWNRVTHTTDHPLWKDIHDGERFYFVHSYYADSQDPDQVAGQTEYGITFTSAAAQGNLFAVQFHPEKSQRAGLTLLKNFINWNGTC
ncbi:MAG: imidazole glycerol phosphate synthase subunit HisH [Gammaproteobacteria bacterium]|nr:imidazole glycerol phosphate synthase subunit HisH [Gammaproteobacteria bacterium]